MMDGYFDLIAAMASKKVEFNWKGRLSGLDVWTYSDAR